MLNGKIKIIKEISLFLLCFFLLFSLVNTIYNYCVLRNNELDYNEDLFLKEFKDNINILIFGDSRVATAINPKYILGMYNYATPGETYNQTYYRARKILNNDNKLDLIILPYDLQSFSRYREGVFSNLSFWKKFMSFDEIVKETGRPRSALYLNSIFPFIGNGRDLHNISFSPKVHTEKLHGWIRHEQLNYWELSAIEKEKEGYTRAREHLKHYPETINNNLFESFIKTLDLAKKNNKQVLLIKYPVAEYYAKGIEKVGLDRGAYYKELNAKIFQYDNVTILDYQDKYKDKWFFNSDHFNYLGAELFTKQLKIDLGKLYLSEFNK